MSGKLDFDGELTLSLPVADLNRAIDWYQKVLGFHLDFRMDDVGWCELKSPVDNVTVGLSVVEKPNPGGATPTFGVKDIEAAKASLESDDVRIDGEIITIENMVSLLTFYDVDGNTLMFAQLLAQNE